MAIELASGARESATVAGNVFTLTGSDTRSITFDTAITTNGSTVYCRAFQDDDPDVWEVMEMTFSDSGNGSLTRVDTRFGSNGTSAVTFSGTVTIYSVLDNDNFPLLGFDTDTWHNVGGAGEPAFANSWTNFASDYQVARFTKSAGVVYVEGFVKSGSPVNSTVFTLPAGYRPSGTLTFAQIAGGTALCWINVAADGTLAVIGGGSASFTGITLSFLVDQV